MSKLVPFAFEDALVRSHLDENGQPWFVAKDVCSVLKIEWKGSDSTGPLDDDEKGLYNIQTPGGEQEMLTISESGLYSLIFRSRKPEAKRFRKWVTAEVLPALRKTGAYALAAAKPRYAPEPFEPLPWLNDEENAERAIEHVNNPPRTYYETLGPNEQDWLSAMPVEKKKEVFDKLCALAMRDPARAGTLEEDVVNSLRTLYGEPDYTLKACELFWQAYLALTNMGYKLDHSLDSRYMAICEEELFELADKEGLDDLRGIERSLPYGPAPMLYLHPRVTVYSPILKQEIQCVVFRNNLLAEVVNDGEALEPDFTRREMKKLLNPNRARDGRRMKKTGKNAETGGRP